MIKFETTNKFIIQMYEDYNFLKNFNEMLENEFKEKVYKYLTEYVKICDDNINYTFNDKTITNIKIGYESREAVNENFIRLKIDSKTQNLIYNYFRIMRRYKLCNPNFHHNIKINREKFFIPYNDFAKLNLLNKKFNCKNEIKTLKMFLIKNYINQTS